MATLLKKIEYKLIEISQNIFKELWYVFCTEKNVSNGTEYSYNNIWYEFTELIKKNKAVKYHLKTINCGKSGDYKWVGGVIRDDKIYGIPTDETCLLEFNYQSGKTNYIGDLSEGNFKWSGGCLYKGSIYGFPRSSQNLLVLPEEQEKQPKEMPLEIVYDGEHHYGGVCTNEGVVYQPPRNTDNILKIDLNTKKVREIHIGKKRRLLRYCGAIQHPNGLIYMFPEKSEKVMALDPKTDKVSFIGKQITSMVFGACVHPDGNIYGYSAYGKGMIKVDVKNNKVYKMFTKYTFGVFGTILGINGHVLGVPGDGDNIYDYDVETGNLNIIAKLKECGKAKCAGASMDSKGNIYCIPAMGNKIYKLCPSIEENISEELLNSSLLNGNY